MLISVKAEYDRVGIENHRKGMVSVKRIFRKNQIMITALAIMIAVAGYLNFAGEKIGEEDFLSQDGSGSALTYEMSDISDEDMYAISMTESNDGTITDYTDIASLDTDDTKEVENYLSENMEITGNSEETISADASKNAAVEANAEAVQEKEAVEEEIPGEAVFTSATGVTSLAGAKLLKEQTRAPFFSKSISEFWRRWHISLSSWLRDYVYIPLGGSRCSKPRHYLNTMITFLISGLWHGASWHFVFWGAIQGAMIVIGDMLSPLKNRVKEKAHIHMEVVLTFSLSVVSFIFFRADSVRDGFYYLERMVTRFDIWSLTSGNIYHMGLDTKEMGVLFGGILILFIVDWCYEKKKLYFDTLIKKQCLAVQYVAAIGLLLAILIFGVYGQGYDATQFIYWY